MTSDELSAMKADFRKKTLDVVRDVASQELGIAKGNLTEETEIPNNASGFMVGMRMANAIPGGGGNVLFSLSARKAHLCTLGELADQCVEETFKNFGM